MHRLFGLLAIPLALAVGGCVLPYNSTSCTPRSKLTVEQATELAYNAGFTTEGELVAIVAIGIAESSLITNKRNWHPEYGPRQTDSRVCAADPTPSDGVQQHADRGLWQISSYWQPSWSDPQTDHPETAAWIARQLYLAEGFTVWDVWDSGAAHRHYDAPYNGWPAVRPIVRAFLAS